MTSAVDQLLQPTLALRLGGRFLALVAAWCGIAVAGFVMALMVGGDDDVVTRQGTLVAIGLVVFCNLGVFGVFDRPGFLFSGAAMAIGTLVVYGTVFRGFELTYLGMEDNLRVYEHPDGTQEHFGDESPRLWLFGLSIHLGAILSYLIVAARQISNRHDWSGPGRSQS